MLGAGREHQQRLGQRRDGLFAWGEEQVAHFLGQGCAAGFPRGHEIDAVLAETPFSRGEAGRLAGAVGAFQRHETASACHPPAS